MTETASPPPARATVAFVYTSDLHRAARFFGETLGLRQVVDQGACKIYRAAPHSLWGVCDLADRPQDAAGVTLTLVLDDEAAVDTYFAAITGRGAEIAIRPRFSERFGVYAGLVRSPDGHRIEVQTLPSFP
ncbi:MAG: VOC family protein [Pseudomonadota bacterium]